MQISDELRDACRFKPNTELDKVSCDIRYSFNYVTVGTYQNVFTVRLHDRLKRAVDPSSYVSASSMTGEL